MKEESPGILSREFLPCYTNGNDERYFRFKGISVPISVQYTVNES